MLGIGLVICVAMFVGMFVVGGSTVEIRSERLQRTVQTDQGGGQDRGGEPQGMMPSGPTRAAGIKRKRKRKSESLNPAIFNRMR